MKSSLSIFRKTYEKEITRAEEYTVPIGLNRDQNDFFAENYYDNEDKNLSYAYLLQKYLIKEINSIIE